ncbi:ABC transporter G family member 11-like [Iris pallida]|uniref:ABC transporter G family member 11-like n=1 Tax=Iris pallida TaxID=29817 RepID=A0AAX6HFV1_IRIPA|nr:ABC transporter G family member 11-like [Iris pallida]
MSQSDDPLDNMTTTEVTQILVEFYNHSRYYYTTRSRVDEVSRLKGSVMDFGGSQASFLVQASTLTKRSFVNMTRDIGYYWLRLASYIVVSVCIGTIFVNVGTKFTSIRARSASAFFIMTFLTFMSIGGFPSFAEDLKVFHKERLNRYYGVSAFVIGNTLSSAPFLMLIASVSGTISYFIVGLHPGFSHYLFFNLCLYASVCVVESMMMAIASVLPNFLMGVMIGAGIQGIFLLVSGYFRRIDDIPKPVWRYPMTYISFHYWDLQGAYLNDMRGLTFDNLNPELPKIPGEYVLENTLMVDLHRSKWWDLTVLLAMVVVYRILFFVMIKLSEDVVPWIRGYIARKRLTRASTVF